ncbi:MAG TPA: hypothetical protein VIE36_05395 [Methylomirabilota bacterium]
MLIGTVLLLLALAPAAAAAPRERVTVETRGDRVTLRAEQAPLAEVLQHLAKATGFSVHSAEPLDAPVTLDLRDVSLQDALRQLLRFSSTLAIYDGERGRLSALYVVAKNPESWLPLGVNDPGTPPSDAQLLDAQAHLHAEVTASLPHRVERVDEVDGELRRLAAEEPQRVSWWLQGLLVDPHPGARLTALQAIEHDRGLDLDALAAAFKDPDLAVQQSALQILVGRGANDQAVERIRAAAETQDVKELRLLIMEATSR